MHKLLSWHTRTHTRMATLTLMALIINISARNLNSKHDSTGAQRESTKAQGLGLGFLPFALLLLGLFSFRLVLLFVVFGNILKFNLIQFQLLVRATAIAEARWQKVMLRLHNGTPISFVAKYDPGMYMTLNGRRVTCGKVFAIKNDKS